MEEFKFIIGIDEVGRGPIAGPVAVCSFVIKDEKLLLDNEIKHLPKLKDSKKLSILQLEKWYKYINKSKEENLCDYKVSYVDSNMIDKFGISKCIQKSLNNSLSSLNIKPDSCFIYLDGGLKAPEIYLNQETIIKGDELYPVISLASIVAKINRDKIMLNYEKIYPKYGFEKHKGYGTKLHYEMIKKQGITPIHRKTFIH